jgi:hypothetical protein
VKTEHVNAIVAFIRRLRPADVLLPVGAALVSAGLQHLADRERNARAQLDELQTAAAGYRDALRDAGAEIATWLEEPAHPLDPGVPWLAKWASADESEPATADEPPTPRGQALRKYAIAAAVAAGVVAWSKRDELLALVLSRGGVTSEDFLPEGVKPDLTPHPHSGVTVDYDQLGEQTPADLARNHAAAAASRARYEASTGSYRYRGELCPVVGLPVAVIPGYAEGYGWFFCCGAMVDPDHAVHALQDEGFQSEGARAPGAVLIAVDTLNAPDATAEEYAAAAELLADVFKRPKPDDSPAVNEAADPNMPNANLIHGHEIDKTPLEECGWPSCDWTSDPEKSPIGQGTQAAVHRNRCVYRPAGAKVAD